MQSSKLPQDRAVNTTAFWEKYHEQESLSYPHQTKVFQGYVLMFDLLCNKQLKKLKGKKDKRLSRPWFFLYLDQLSPIALDIRLPVQVTESINDHFMIKLRKSTFMFHYTYPSWKTSNSNMKSSPLLSFKLTTSGSNCHKPGEQVIRMLRCIRFDNFHFFLKQPQLIFRLLSKPWRSRLQTNVTILP